MSLYCSGSGLPKFVPVLCNFGVILASFSVPRGTQSVECCICFCKVHLASLHSSSNHMLAECLALSKPKSIIKIKSILLEILILK